MFKADRPRPNRRLKVAAIVGHATPDSVRLWVRTGRPGEFSVLVFRREANAEDALREAPGAAPLSLDHLESLVALAQRKDFEVDNCDADTTRVLDVRDPTPDTRYGYLHLRPGRRTRDARA